MSDPSLTHVLPQADERDHVSDVMCPCMPKVMDDGMVRHNSYDGREIGEVCRLALDSLGKALVDEGHEWTDEERDQYEHAVMLLNTKYPPTREEPLMEGVG